MVQFRKKYLIIAYVISLSLVFLLANNSKVSAMDKRVEVKSKTDIVYTIEKNDVNSLEQVKKAILKEDSKYVLEPKELKTDIENSELVITDIDLNTNETQKIKATVLRYGQSNGERVLVDEVIGEVFVRFEDNVAPVIKLSKTSLTIEEGTEFSAKDQIVSVTDNVDHHVDVVINGEVDVEEPGKYVLEFVATDKAGNKTVEKMTVIVEEIEEEEEEIEEEEEVLAEAAQAASEEQQDPSFGYDDNAVVSGDYVSRALALVGANMHCTQLTSTVLQGKTGGYLSLSPAGTMAYTTPVSTMQPGDILYYNDAGAGVPHVAVYIGNGQAVHGGVNGQVVVASAHLGSGVAAIGRP